MLPIVSSHVASAFVSADLLGAAPSWCPAYFAGPASAALRAGRAGSTIADLGGQVLEGWRVSETPGAQAYDPRAAETPIYRQSNVGRFQLLLAEGHWAAPQMANRWCVRPGDVVLNKFAPLRAAVVSPAARRHPVDGNSLIVRGLPRPLETWLAVCLNRPEYEHLLLIESGLMRRVGIGSMSGLRLPPVPGEMAQLGVALRELLDDTLLVEGRLHQAKAEAAELSQAPSGRDDLREGMFFGARTLSSDSWLPNSISLAHDQSRLADELEWRPLRVLAHAAPRRRLPSVPGGARALRLSDVADDLFVAESSAQDDPSEINRTRTLDKPLIPGEVLLSTLGTSFRTAYVDEGVPRHTYVSDGWVRLRFRETPAAWALLLSTPAAREQTRRLAIGSVQQFVPPEALLNVHVPTPDRETRDRWQRILDRHHAQRRELEQRWHSLLSALARVYDHAHGRYLARPSRDREVLQ